MVPLTKEKRPPNPEATDIETGVEAMGALFDGLEDTGVPLRQSRWNFSLDKALFAVNLMMRGRETTQCGGSIDVPCGASGGRSHRRRFRREGRLVRTAGGVSRRS